MKDRFDLEIEIVKLHTLADNIGLISEGIIEYGLDTDKIINAIEGIRVLLDLQASKLFDIMTDCFNLDKNN